MSRWEKAFLVSNKSPLHKYFSSYGEAAWALLRTYCINSGLCFSLYLFTVVLVLYWKMSAETNIGCVSAPDLSQSGVLTLASEHFGFSGSISAALPFWDWVRMAGDGSALHACFHVCNHRDGVSLAGTTELRSTPFCRDHPSVRQHQAAAWWDVTAGWLVL